MKVWTDMCISCTRSTSAYSIAPSPSYAAHLDRPAVEHLVGIPVLHGRIPQLAQLLLPSLAARRQRHRPVNTDTTRCSQWSTYAHSI